MNLTQLHHDVRRYHKKRKRVGRGDGSGHGGTSGRGGKGQSARSGYHTKGFFEGGQMPLIRKTPKRGFNNTRFQLVTAIINLRDLNKFENNDTITPATLKKRGLINGEFDRVKILAKGELEKEGLTVEAHSFSAAAAKKIGDKKGKIVLINPPPPEPPRAVRKTKEPPVKAEKQAPPAGTDKK